MSDAISGLAVQLTGQLATPTAWLIGTTYTAGQAVSRSGLNYYAVQGSTGVDPATDSGNVNWGLLTGSGAQASTMWALFQALIQGVIPMLASRVSRRVGLLNTACASTFNMLIGGCGVGDVAQCFTECREVANLYGNLQAFSSSVAAINPNDRAIILANVSAARILALGSALLAFAATYEGFTTETLPS